MSEQITTTLLRSLGAIRPMAPASDTVFRMGEFVEIDAEFSTGVYPLFFRWFQERTGLLTTRDKWLEMSVYGYGKFKNPTHYQLLNLILALNITWLCSCNYYNQGNICTKCGKSLHDRIFNGA